MKFYIASKSQVVAREWKAALEAEEYTIVARWLDEDGFGSGAPYDDEQRSSNAVKDEEDVRAADALIFRSEPDGTRVAGGKHVETGIAIALGKPVYAIGPKENIFHWHPLVKMFATFGDFMQYLLETDSKCRSCGGAGRVYASYGDLMDRRLSNCPACGGDGSRRRHVDELLERDPNAGCGGPFAAEVECPGELDYQNPVCKKCINNAEEALAELQ